MRVLRSVVSLAVVATLVACGSGGGRAKTVAKLEKAFRDAGLNTHVVDRHSENIGPPAVHGCDPPLIAARPDGAFATLYVCAESSRARSGNVPAYYPGRRVVRGSVIAVLNGPPAFTNEVATVLRAALS